jgi:glyoxylase-like metal-dependent hydrolase (beta-lactamase superfamily II)
METDKQFEFRARIDEHGRIKIPSFLRKKYGFHANDEVFFRGTDKGVEIRAKDQPTRILDALYLVGGLGISHPWDGASYLIKSSRGSQLIDCGTEMGFEYIVENIRELGVNPEEIDTIILTHCHYDHSAAAHLFRQNFGTKITIHELGKKPIEEADDKWTASYVYRRVFPGFSIDKTLRDGQVIEAGEVNLRAIHLPGHCPDNTAFYGVIDNKRVCFVGDIGGGHSENWFSSIEDTKNSIVKLQSMDIDILCHGHLLLTDKERIEVQLQTWWQMAQDAWFDYMLYDRL